MRLLSYQPETENHCTASQVMKRFAAVRPSLVHPGEDVLGPLLGRVGGPRGAGAQHVVDGLHDLGHFLLVDDAVPVDVVHPESGGDRERVEMRRLRLTLLQ